MREEKALAHTPIDTPEAKRFAAAAAGGWLVALVLLPSGGLLWQTGAIAELSHWLMSSVFARLQLSGFFI